MSFLRLRFKVYDLPTENIQQHFSEANDFIHSARLSGGNVLVHCFAGMSRSATVVIAYVMSTSDYGYSDAMDLVQQVRCIDPNMGFKRQLINFEREGLQTERFRLRNTYGSRWCEWNRQLTASAPGGAREDEMLEKKNENAQGVGEDSTESNNLI